MAKNLTRNGGRWTEARYNQFIKSAIRSMSYKWGPRFDALHNAEIGVKINEKTGRKAKHYECAICREQFPAKEVQVDHVHPIVPTEGTVDWNIVIENVLCEIEGLQVLCKECHSKKSKEENAERRANRANS